MLIDVLHYFPANSIFGLLRLLFGLARVYSLVGCQNLMVIGAKLVHGTHATHLCSRNILRVMCLRYCAVAG